MSAEAKNVRLDEPVLAALQEAAARHHKTLDEMASEAVMEGLKAERLDRVQALLAKGQRHGAASGIPENQVVDLIHADRKERRRTR
jgi:plasmid stability protein